MKKKLSDLSLYSTLHYPQNYKWEQTEFEYIPIPKKIYDHLCTMLPVGKRQYGIFNKALWIVEVGKFKDRMTGVYQHDEFYYLVKINKY